MIMKNKSRNSNIEILRIISMSMIILHHLSYYGIMHNPFFETYQLWKEIPVINKIISCLFLPGGEVGVGIFFLITGYYSVHSYVYKEIENDATAFVNTWNSTIRKSLRIITQVFFYSVISIFVYLIVLKISPQYACGRISTNLNKLITVLLIPNSSGEYWFITAYLMLLFMIPIINNLIYKMNCMQKKIIFVGIWFFLYVIGDFGAVISIFYKALFFYVLGAWIRKKYDIQRNTKGAYLVFAIILWLLLTAFEFINGMLIIYQSAAFSYVLTNVIEHFKSMFIAPAICVLIFVSCIKLKPFSNSVINKISGCTLAVYLSHEMPFTRSFVWNGIFKLNMIANSNYLILISIIALVSIFSIGYFCEFIRSKMPKKYINRIETILLVEK